MKLFVGLGNPGTRYIGTRHNVGFQVVERLAKEFKIPLSQKSCSSRWSKGKAASEIVALALPQTFMNLSGQAVACLVQKLKLKPSTDLLIICDEVALPLGSIRIRGQGSSGGHLGLESIIEALGGQEFPRLRFGVGSQPLPKDLTNYVLGKFGPNEQELLRTGLDRAVQASQVWLSEGVTAAMNQFNRRAHTGGVGLI